MSLLHSLRFHISLLLSFIPIQLNTLKFFFFSPIHFILGTDPQAHSAFPSLASLPSPSLEGQRKPCPYAHSLNAHAYRKPGPDDSRSPCPALNTMANHGYLPHNGRNLTGTILTHALMECYALSWPLAAFLAWGGVLLLGQVGTLSLHDLARHNRIEHDASLTHVNTPFSDDYAPIHNDPVLFEEFVADSRKGKFGAQDIARARVRREKELGAEVTAVQQEIARGEVALVLQIFGEKEFAVPVDIVRTWWGENRLPEGWKPTRVTTLRGTVGWASNIRDAMAKLREKGEKSVQEGLLKEKTVAKQMDENENELEQMDRPKNVCTPPTANGTLEWSEYGSESEGTLYTSPTMSASTSAASTLSAASALKKHSLPFPLPAAATTTA